MPCPPDCPEEETSFLSGIFPLNIGFKPPKVITGPPPMKGLTGEGGQCDPLGACEPGGSVNVKPGRFKRQKKRAFKKAFKAQHSGPSGKVKKSGKKAEIQLLIDKGIIMGPDKWKLEKQGIKTAFKSGEISRKEKRQFIKSKTGIADLRNIRKEE